MSTADAREQAIERAVKVIHAQNIGPTRTGLYVIARALADAGLLRTEAAPVDDELPTAKQWALAAIDKMRADLDKWAEDRERVSKATQATVDATSAMHAQVVKLRAEVKRAKELRDLWAKKAHETESERDELRRQVEAVRRRHRGPTWCSDCGHKFPCPTIRALDGAEGGA